MVTGWIASAEVEMFVAFCFAERLVNSRSVNSSTACSWSAAYAGRRVWTSSPHSCVGLEDAEYGDELSLCQEKEVFFSI